MEKVNSFIRRVNLELARKLKVIPITEVAKRFLIDGNAKYFDAISEDSHSNEWGLFIEKVRGKYKIVHWSHTWSDDAWNNEEDADISEEKVQVTSDYRKVIKAINGAIDDEFGYDCWWAKDSHHTNVDWEVIRDPSDLYDDTEEVDVGELPEGFKPVEELEPVPEEIKL
jgi:hypothetical protein